MRGTVLALVLAAAPMVACRQPDTAAAVQTSVPVTITSAAGRHVILAEPARSAAAQEHGLMFRTDLKPDGGMLFWPYPPEGEPPRDANFWMKNTPTPLDIVFIRADGTIARIAANAVPFSETPLPSGEPVAAILEIVGGRADALGIAEGDHVDWPGRTAKPVAASPAAR